MDAQAVEALLEKLKALPSEQRAEVEDFVDFLSVRAKKRAARSRHQHRTIRTVMAGYPVPAPGSDPQAASEFAAL
jgi:hypothetical protein